MTRNWNIKRLIAVGLVFAFLGSLIQPSYAQEFILPAPGVMVHLSPPFNPPILKGIKVHPNNPFRFDFILDKGDGELSDSQIKDESSKLIKYFLASLTIPEKDLWVNLSPYEKDRIIPNSFGLTEMGRDLLAEDYMLKQITASLIYPEGDIGKKFWKLIYQEAEKKYGTTNVPINTFNKVWIVPEKAVVYENVEAGTAYVLESRLKVMLEQDYLSLAKHEGTTATIQNQETNQLGSQLVREIVIPELTKEVNEDKNFTQLRQVYNSLILATWCKKKIKDSILEQVYTDKNKVVGVNIDDPQEKEKIYQRYLQAFKRGVFNYIQDTPDHLTQEIIPRKYFSGGVDMEKFGDSAMKVITDQDQLPNDSAMLSMQRNVIVTAGIVVDSAMTTEIIHILETKNLIPPGISQEAQRQRTRDLLLPVSYHSMGDSILSKLIDFNDFKAGPFLNGELKGAAQWDYNLNYARKLFSRELSKAVHQGLYKKDPEKAKQEFETLLQAFIHFEDQDGHNFYENLTGIQNVKVFVRLTNLVLFNELDHKDPLMDEIAYTANSIPTEAFHGGILESSLNALRNSNDRTDQIKFLRTALKCAVYASAPKIYFSDIDVQNNFDHSVEHTRRLMEEGTKISLVLDSTEDFVDEVLRRTVNQKMVYFVDDNGDMVYQLHLAQIYLAINSHLQITMVPKNGRYAIDADYEDVMNELAKEDFKDLRLAMERGRFTVTNQGPEYPGIHLDEISPELINILAEADVVMAVGQVMTENLNGLKKPIYLLSSANSPVTQVVTGLPKGSYYFTRVYGKYYNGYSALALKAKRTLNEYHHPDRGTGKQIWETLIRRILDLKVPVYLASTSPRRKELLAQANLPFRTISAEFTENNQSSRVPQEVVLRNARGKALAGAKNIRDGIVIGVDTLMAFKDQIIGKPANMEVAYSTLGQFQGNIHQVISGVSLLWVKDGVIQHRRDFTTVTSIHIKKMSRNDMVNYFSKVSPLDKAGAYGVQEDPRIYEAMDGSFSNVMGLPMEDLALNLEKLIDKNENDNAMKSTGGIDFTAGRTALEIQNSGQGIKFHLDSTMLAKLKNAPGFVPVIIKIQPMVNLRLFLGLERNPEKLQTIAS